MTDTTASTSVAPVDDIRAHNKDLIFAALAEAGIDSDRPDRAALEPAESAARRDPS